MAHLWELHIHLFFASKHQWLWSSITRMGTLRGLLHGEKFFLSLNTTLLMGMTPYMQVCIFLFVCFSVLTKASPSRWSKVSENGKFVLDRRLYADTQTQDRPKEGCGEVIPGTAICKSICCLQLSFLLWDSESHNSLAFPGQFPSTMAVEDLRKATYPICVSMGQKTESRCVPSQTT